MHRVEFYLELVVLGLHNWYKTVWHASVLLLLEFDIFLQVCALTTLILNSTHELVNS